MNDLPSRVEAEKILKNMGCPENLVKHSKLVADLAVEIAKKIVERGLINVDVKLVEVGALLHDIGKIKTRSILHGYAGGEIARKLNLPSSLVNIIERHVGAGIPEEETVKYGLPRKSFLLETIEEKIVAYADKRVKNGRVVEFNDCVKEFERKLGKNHPAIGRLKNLHKDVISALGYEF
ncbi:MAG: HDIG domain-containing metalloprotein [Candidatus Bathyarchaeota archaeon]